MGGQFAFPDDESRLQGGACGSDLPRWDFLTGLGPALYAAKPHDEAQKAWNEAKEVFCARCPILERCGAKGESEYYGIWGGRDQYERFKTRKAAYRRQVRVEKQVLAFEDAPALDAAVVALESARVADFPEENPEGRDGWTRDRHIVMSAWYMAQTADGEYVRMKLKTKGSGVIKWFPAEDVDLRRPVAVVIEDRVGRPRKEKRAQSAEGVAGREVA